MNARRIGCVVLGLGIAGLGALGATAVGLALGRHAVATHIARGRLEGAGIHCDERFAVELALTLDEIAVAPTSCTLSGGTLQSVELLEPMHATLGAEGRVPRLHAAAVRVVLRPGAQPLPSDAWGLASQVLAIPSKLGEIAQGIASLAARDLPELEVDRLELAYGEGPSATFVEVRRTPGRVEAARASLARLEAPGGMGAEVSITALVATARGSHAELDGELEIRATIPGLGTSEEHMHAGLVTEGLNDPSPAWSLRGR